MSSAADKYVQARAEGQSKLEASVRAVGTGMISYFTETLGGIGGSKSPLGKLEEKAGEKLITSILYNAFEEGGEEFLEYAADILLDGAADMVFKGEWQQEWSWEEVIENAKIGAMTGGLFGGYQRLMNKIYTGNPETDAQLDRAAREYADYIRDAYLLQSDPELRAMAERQMGETDYGSVFDGNAAGVQQNAEAAAGVQQSFEQNKKAAEDANHIKEQIRENQELLSQKEVAARVNIPIEDVSDKRNIRSWAASILESSGYKADNPELGTVIFDKKRINGAVKYLKTPEEFAAFAALPDVITKGNVLAAHEDHKGRNYGTYTIIAPVEINGKRGNMAVVVRKTSDNFYKVHRVLSPDGSMLSAFEIKNTDTRNAGGYTEDSGAHAQRMMSVSEDNIPQNGSGVNSRDGKKPGAVSAEERRVVEYRSEEARSAQEEVRGRMVSEGKTVYIPEDILPEPATDSTVQWTIQKPLSNARKVNAEALFTDDNEITINIRYGGIENAIEELSKKRYETPSTSIVKNILENAEYIYSARRKIGAAYGQTEDYFYAPVKIGDRTIDIKIKQKSSEASGNSSGKKPGTVSAEEMYGLRPKAESKPGEITDADVAKPVDFKSMYGVDPDTQRKNGKGLSFEEWAESTKKPEQNKKAAEAVENKEPKVQSYEDFKKNPPADGEKSPIKVSPYTVIKSPYEGESPNNKADAKSERVEVSAESFAEGKSVYEIRTNGAGQAGIASKVKKALTDILNSIGGQHSVTANNIEFGGKTYEVAVNMSIAGKLAGSPKPSAEKFAVLKSIDGIIENAEYVGSGDYIQHTAKDKNVTRYDYFETKATIDGKPYVVAFDVEVYPDNNRYRTHKVLNEINLTPVPSAEPGPVPGAQGKKSGLQGDVPSPETNIPQNGNGVNSENQVNFEKAVEEAKKNAVTDEELIKERESERQRILERRIEKAGLDMGADELVDFAQAMGQIKGFFGSEFKDFARIFDDVASSKPIRNKLHELFEKPHREAQAQYTQNYKNAVKDLSEKFSELGIKAGTKESSAVQRIGEGVYQVDSKGRDEEGRLLTVYHGSDSEFFVFDRTKARANMDIQGSFFSPWEIDAQGYGGKIGEYYLNIVNPASEAMGYKALKKFQGQNGAGIKAREYLQSLGYDGVNNGGEEYIAFESNQIKKVTNKAPTENPDIRFSKRKKLDTFNAEGYNEIKLGKQEYARLSAAIGTEQPNAKGIVTQILDNENGEPAFVYTAFVSDDKLRVLKKKEVKYAERKRRNYVDRKSRDSIGYSGESGYKRSDSFALLGDGRNANERNDGVFGGIARGRDGRNGRGSNQNVSDSGEGSRESLTVSDSAASGEVTLEVKKSTAEDDYTYDNIAIILDGKEVGTIGVMADENEPYLERIDIDEAYRNKGIGTDALRLVAEKYGDFLIAPDNEDAKRLYERYGDESRQETHSQNHSPLIKAAHAHFEHGLLFALCGYAVFILTRSLSAISAINSLLVGLPLPL